jgi:uncharacterized Zn finger protein
MKSECPNCRSRETKNVITYNKGNDNIDGLGHFHLECPQCGRHFNLWECGDDALKKAFGGVYRIYL